MSEEATRQTRSQKRAMEREAQACDLQTKMIKLEKSEPGSETEADGVGLPTILKAGEMKATIKVEVQTGDEPVDMSTSRSDLRPPSPDDIIVLSDNEPSSPQVNGVSHSSREMDTDLLMRSSPDVRDHILKQLKEELRLEEAKLVLLKKLRQSQIQKELPAQKLTVSGTPPPLVRDGIVASKGSTQMTTCYPSGTVILPVQMRGQQVSSKPSSQTAQVVIPSLVKPTQIHTLRQQQQRQHSGSGPQSLLLAPRTAVQGQKQGLIRVANMANASVLVSIPQGSSTNLKGSSVIAGNSLSVGNGNDSPAARQAAAKLALRKQLEKTLLEIPSPKPPAPDFTFLPSAANNEFIYLVGLETVVQSLLDTLGKGKQLAATVGAAGQTPKDPFTCSQCKTDFTSRWRQEKSGTAMCDGCMSTRQKKVLKAEHTTRLKAAFVKALQQEQEIEQSLQQASKTPSASVKLEQVLVSKQTRVSSLQQSRGSGVGHHLHNKQATSQLSRSVQPVGSRASTHTFPTSSQLQNAITAAAALVSRPGKHAARTGAKGSSRSSSSSSNRPADAWRRRSNVPAGVAVTYVNPNLAAHKTSSAVDRQREYLLDMIPSRSISQTANAWK